jgi:hypothetical protein
MTVIHKINCGFHSTRKEKKKKKYIYIYKKQPHTCHNTGNYAEGNGDKISPTQ